MKKSQFTKEQIICAPRQAGSAALVANLRRQLGVSEASVYDWKKRYSKSGVTEFLELRQFCDENVRLKSALSDLIRDKQILNQVMRKTLKQGMRRPTESRTGSD